MLASCRGGRTSNLDFKEAIEAQAQRASRLQHTEDRAGFATARAVIATYLHAMSIAEWDIHEVIGDWRSEGFDLLELARSWNDRDLEEWCR